MRGTRERKVEDRPAQLCVSAVRRNPMQEHGNRRTADEPAPRHRNGAAVAIGLVLGWPFISGAVSDARAQDALPPPAASTPAPRNANVPPHARHVHRPKPRVAGLPLARPSTAAGISIAPAGSLDTRAVAPKWGLLGNVGGVRDDLYRAGIRLDGSVDYEAGTNVQGGLYGQGAQGAGQVAVKAALDMERLASIKGGTVNIVVTDRFGRSLTADQGLQLLQQTEEVYGRGQKPRLTQLSYDQQFGHFIDLKFGRLPVSDDFAGFSCEFQNLTFCGNQPGNIVGNYWYNWPVSQYAGRLRLGNLDTGYIMAGLYQVNPRDLADGFNFNPTGGTGALAIVEAAAFPTLGTANYRGSYTIGGWYETDGGPDLYYNSAGLPLSVAGGTPLAHQERNGIYGVAVQELYRPEVDNPSRNVSGFVRAAFGNSRTSSIDQQITFGAIYKGFWTARPLDWIGIGLGVSHASSAIADGVEAANVFNGSNLPVPGYERIIEAFYSIAVTPDVVIRPNIQYINQPGGVAGRTDVVVFGIKSGVTF